ncbi:MAG TPA: hypothetical protein PL074_00280 [Thermoflexales bacterium]|nr:hypothetical protein [Thermoflexales bacterium]HQX74713.1 hypothetical protein [Thermoflexales bacterium]
MAFTYDLSTDIGKVRLELGDAAQPGVKPDGGNLTDEELTLWLEREGLVMRAVAAACEALSRMWASVATISVGPRKEDLGSVSKTWWDRGVSLRSQFGNTPSGDAESATTGSFGITLLHPQHPLEATLLTGGWQ